MSEEQMAKMELEIRKALSSEVKEHREFLEKLFLRVVWGAATLATITGIIVTYFSYETFTKIENKATLEIKERLAQIVTRESAEEFLKADVREIADKMAKSGDFSNIVEEALSRTIKKVTEAEIKTLLAKQLAPTKDKGIEQLIDAAVSNQISPLKKRPFSGGMFETNDLAGNACSVSNPYTAKCECAAGFTKNVVAYTKGHDGRDKFLFLCTGNAA